MKQPCLQKRNYPAMSCRLPCNKAADGCSKSDVVFTLDDVIVDSALVYKDILKICLNAGLNLVELEECRTVAEHAYRLCRILAFTALDRTGCKN